VLYDSYKVRNASLLVDKANSGVSYYKNQRIPDLTLTAQGFYFENIPLIPQNNVFVGATLSWPLLQWGKKNMDVSISNLRLKQANIQLKDTKKEASSQIKTKLAELRNALQLLQTAEQAYKFRREELRLKTDAFENGLISYNDYSSVQEKNLDTETSLVKA
jgi:outer membrane protein TolC